MWFMTIFEYVLYVCEMMENYACLPYHPPCAGQHKKAVTCAQELMITVSNVEASLALSKALRAQGDHKVRKAK